MLGWLRICHRPESMDPLSGIKNAATRKNVAKQPKNSFRKSPSRIELIFFIPDTSVRNRAIQPQTELPRRSAYLHPHSTVVSHEIRQSCGVVFLLYESFFALSTATYEIRCFILGSSDTYFLINILILIRKASPEGAACFVIYKERNHKTSLI